MSAGHFAGITRRLGDGHLPARVPVTSRRTNLRSSINSCGPIVRSWQRQLAKAEDEAWAMSCSVSTGSDELWSGGFWLGRPISLSLLVHFYRLNLFIPAMNGLEEPYEHREQK